MKTKICLFIKTLNNSGGTERVAAVLARELVKCNYEVHFVTWYCGAKSFYGLDDDIKVHSIFEHCDGNIYKDYLKSLKIYRKLLRSISPDYLIDVCVPLSLLSLPAALGTKIKIVEWEHFNTSVNWNRYTGRLSRTLVAKLTHHVVTLTNADKKNYLEKFKAKKVTTIPNPVTIIPGGEPDLDAKNILAIGRFTEQKGFDLLLPIWAKVSAQKPDWKLRIVGDGPLKQEILKLADDLNLKNSVEFVAPTLAIDEYYRSSSVFVMTSRFEGLPLVLIEAKAVGLPIISYDCETGPRDIINHNSDGILVPYLNEEKYVEELLAMMDDKERRQRFNHNAKTDAARFNVDIFVSSWKKILA